MKASPSLPPAIVLGGDSAIALTVIRELGRHGVPVIAVDQAAHALARRSRFVRQFVQPPADGTPLEQWLPPLIRQSGAKVLFAIGEKTLLNLSELPDIIDGCRISTPRRDQLAVVLDKTRTLEIARALGLSTPDCWQPRKGEDFAAEAAGLSYPAVLKWSDPPAIWALLKDAGLPFLKAEYAEDSQGLLGLLSRYDALGRWPMVQSWCGGYGMGQMLLMEQGRALLRFQHRRLREYPATGGISTLCAAVPPGEHAEQMRLSEALLAALGWRGSAMVEYRHDPETGRYWLMEVNGRFWGSMALASQCGVCFAWEEYRRALDPDAEEAPQPPYPPRRARFVVPDTKRLARIWRSPASGALSGRARFSRWRETLSYLSDFFDRATGYYIWDRNDPMPFFTDMLAILRRERHRDSAA
ncbi:hypothetical protein GCM10007897_43340 [Sphingobium jiangsuense]|uniref:Putative ATP-grasp superfamily ATP-dependent carboligase n=1 Tax=Sphingobium jiangsuense TaxID=870476 RepID=A0A7W6BED7_9SPHN|nr:carboxylate--amine ligase [Sphingobium jiangsuense]MBB3924574.1 putative ATP-grasp superfamily ATP-dependent carboligase [Sphingobium jiangsuense]GLT02906.1 hypothetical protein GCM10007897_43340 [Sphingobium jiangsuense]